ncbi:ABC transporter ATP-binding protein [Futiania mangrovi]|uniref:ABC transporter ATP-binding protein n=1 Tax=Futiania mangrovi TaxID=2959716 RepID=A0A9J6PH61_9PROT|nr:ABC transporter ATP-binding protein [Futiania mangrovii]MCP1337838.1 ABC transporter ATP-binding protein [Futiania mangrovii]
MGHREMSLIVDKATRRYGTVETVSAVSLRVGAGERVALLGHNGAGKTTLMKMILGLNPVDAGRIEVFGHAPGTRAGRAACAYLPENVAFHSSLTGREQLRLYARLKGEAARAADGLLERVGLADAANRRIGTYSKGMRQRLGLAQAMLGRPKLTVLDEPTSGLDPISRRDFYALVDELAERGAAVLLSSHALTELEARTDRIAILRDGHLVADAALDALRAQAGLPIRLTVRARADAVEEVAGRLGGTRLNGRSVELACAPAEKMDRIGDAAALGALVDDIDVVPPSLEDLYRHFSRRDVP